ncbi:class I adenylate-forming enzyme family protein [Virgibacillus alimentarius]|uniref:Fatty-acyl-CoA synthase n=1 Tax=Virgibacillus alimentarius TaxID=698769 RepID=A0ABS4SBY5_9BACI|nr:AMP-binding protein [Virgibacillus alimentarius]MBP2259023.1 fatty-acyl-CoA synthase [Virgibacillus alimentarius]
MDVGYLVNRVEKHLQTIDPNQLAIKLETEESWTYGELNAWSNKYANSLKRMGVKKGDRVGILLYNNLAYFALYFAIAKLGAIAVRINFRLESEELEYILNDSGCKVLCFDATLSKKMDVIRTSIPVKEYVCLPKNDQPVPDWSKNWEVLRQGDATFAYRSDIDKSDPVMLMYTSGTTGRPKGALWTHENTLWFSSMQALKWGFDSNTVGMTTGPLYHVGALEDIALAALLSGGTVIITKSGNFDIGRVLSVIEHEKVTDCFLFPFMIYEMLNLPEISSFHLDHLQRIYSGGDPITSWAIDQLKELFPHIGLVQVYGLTEGTPIATSLDPEDAESKGYTAGKPMPFTKIKIVDNENKVQGFDTIGEICVKGPAVATEYWQKPEETETTFINGWCHTGDLGYIDQDGYLKISGKKKDMIRSGGENIYPVEVEDVLIRYDGIQDVAVVGIPDPKYIESVCAIIVPKSDIALTEAEILDFIKGKLASYKKPRKIVFMDELPRTASGKVQKFRLRELYR